MAGDGRDDQRERHDAREHPEAHAHDMGKTLANGMAADPKAGERRRGHAQA
jgi:hypothetical protein